MSLGCRLMLESRTGKSSAKRISGGRIPKFGDDDGVGIVPQVRATSGPIVDRLPPDRMLTARTRMPRTVRCMPTLPRQERVDDTHGRRVAHASRDRRTPKRAQERFVRSRIRFPKPHEILVRVAVAGVNPIDWKRRDSPDTPLPLILGQDFAGLVVGTGDRVQRYRLDERVFGIAREHGAYAEFTVVPEDDNAQPVAKIPDGVGDADAAALPTAGLTALACVERMACAKARRCSSSALPGSSDSSPRRLHVTGACESPAPDRRKSMAAVDGLGLDGFVAYDREDVLAALHNAYPKGVDALLDSGRRHRQAERDVCRRAPWRHGGFDYSQR